VLQGERRLRIRFVEKGDRHWFAVALASCLAKYARELVMDAFNAHFARLDPSLAPTAGYVQDGRRWLAESVCARASAGLAEDVLVRSR
jgi:ribonuclease HII